MGRDFFSGRETNYTSYVIGFIFPFFYGLPSFIQSPPNLLDRVDQDYYLRFNRKGV